MMKRWMALLAVCVLGLMGVAGCSKDAATDDTSGTTTPAKGSTSGDKMGSSSGG